MSDKLFMTAWICLTVMFCSLTGCGAVRFSNDPPSVRCIKAGGDFSVTENACLRVKPQ